MGGVQEATSPLKHKIGFMNTQKLSFRITNKKEYMSVLVAK